MRADLPPTQEALVQEPTVEYIGRKKGLWLPCEIDGRVMEALVDTGSTVSLLRPGALVEGRQAAKWSPAAGVKLRSATGDVVAMLGRRQVMVRAAKQEFYHEFWLAPIRDACILGLDFLKAVGAVMDLEGGTIRIGGTATPLVIDTGLVGDWMAANRAAVREPYGSGGAEHAAPGPDGETPVGQSTPQLSTCVTLTAGGAEHAAPVGTGGTAEAVGSAPQQRPNMDIIKELWQRSSEGLTADQSQRLWQLLEQFPDVFAASVAECTRTDLVQHSIDTGESAPIRLRPHRLPLVKRQIARDKIREMAAAGVIEPSCSPWAAPAVLVRKKDGDWRFCVDYRRLNAVTKVDSYPLPRMDDALDWVAESSWFSSLDLRSGYWQVALAPEAKEKTAFTIGEGLWHFNVMAFGLCNSPATFERLMERVLREFPRTKCVVYMDDVLVHAPDFDGALETLRQVFTTLRAARLKLHPRKCKLLQRSVPFLGHVVSNEGVATDPAKVEAVRRWPIPKDVEQLRSFLGLASYYRRFIKGFADIAAPLHQLTAKGVPFQWSAVQEEAFQRLREALVTSPILALPKREGRFTVDTDASNQGIGAVLSQDQNGTERVIAYFSRRLSRPERNYCVTRRELLAVVAALKQFKTYLYGVPFTLRTDHASLTWLLRFREPEGQVARWLAALQEFQFEVQHRAGRQHGNADALSRRPCQGEPCRHCEKLDAAHDQEESRRALEEATTGGTRCMEQEEIQRAQATDAELVVLRGLMQRHPAPTWSEVTPHGPTVRALWSQRERLEERGGKLYRRWASPSPGADIWQLVVPRELRDAVLGAVHGPRGVGHFGVTKTLRRLRQRFYWPGCQRDVELFVHCCDTCTAKKGPGERPHAPLQLLQSGAAMERVAVDFLGPFPETESGNRYVMVAMDYFTKWPEAYAVPDQSAQTTASRLLGDFFCRFGVPEELHSDQGRNFESQVMAEVCEKLGIVKTRTTPLHPQSDGLVERFNATLTTQLAMLTGQHQRDWDLHLPLVLLACRSAVQESTGFTPAMLMFGRELRTPVDLMFGTPPGTGESPESYTELVRELGKRMDSVHRLCREQQRKASMRQKRAYDVRCRGTPLQAGSEVWLHTPQRKKGLSPKLQSAWEGPFQVLERLSEVVYRVQKGRKRVVVHRDRLAPYRPKLAGSDRELGATRASIGARAQPVRSCRVRRPPRRLEDYDCERVIMEPLGQLALEGGAV